MPNVNTMSRENLMKRDLAKFSWIIVACIIACIAGIAMLSAWEYLGIAGGIVLFAGIILIIIAIMVRADHVARWKRGGDPTSTTRDTMPRTILVPGPTRVIERERIIVKLKCKACGLLVENTESTCPNCGATM